MEKPKPVAVEAATVAPRAKPSSYPEPFAARVLGREKRPLGDLFGLTNFGVNLTRLAPGAQSALKHRHSRQDEFVFILEGEPTLLFDNDEVVLRPGMCAGFPAEARRTVLSTVPTETSSISKLATARRATRRAILMTISKQGSAPTVAGS